jgi:hypothetical protein
LDEVIIKWQKKKTMQKKLPKTTSSSILSKIWNINSNIEMESKRPGFFPLCDTVVSKEHFAAEVVM